MFLFILNQPTIFTKFLEIFCRFCIHSFIMFIRSLRKINFRFNNVIQRDIKLPSASSLASY
jgi:hypothetical protein